MKGHWLLWINMLMLALTLALVHWHADRTYVQWGDDVCLWGAAKVEAEMPSFNISLCGAISKLEEE